VKVRGLTMGFGGVGRLKVEVAVKQKGNEVGNQGIAKIAREGEGLIPEFGARLKGMCCLPSATGFCPSR
jgi:hypothetical protein